MCTSVVTAGQCSESLLAGCIPDLHLNYLILNSDVLDFLNRARLVIGLGGVNPLTKSTPMVLKKFSVNEFSYTRERNQIKVLGQC